MELLTTVQRHSSSIRTSALSLGGHHHHGQGTAGLNILNHGAIHSGIADKGSGKGSQQKGQGAAPLVLAAEPAAGWGKDRAWRDLDRAERGAARVLGYQDASWSSNALPANCQYADPEESMRSWEELLPEQQDAAARLGYDDEAWDRAMLVRAPPCPRPAPRPRPGPKRRPWLSSACAAAAGGPGNSCREQPCRDRQGVEGTGGQAAVRPAGRGGQGPLRQGDGRVHAVRRVPCRARLCQDGPGVR